ncbi:E3 Ubiquitin-Protein Ligase Dzip3 [Manis pentadactyla]|nr:E3 Ubiquitin-Protein Ligase Dzip3 [Manis pentadactyla]
MHLRRNRGGQVRSRFESPFPHRPPSCPSSCSSSHNPGKRAQSPLHPHPRLISPAGHGDALCPTGPALRDHSLGQWLSRRFGRAWLPRGRTAGSPGLLPREQARGTLRRNPGKGASPSPPPRSLKGLYSVATPTWTGAKKWCGLPSARVHCVERKQLGSSQKLLDLVESSPTFEWDFFAKGLQNVKTEAPA